MNDYGKAAHDRIRELETLRDSMGASLGKQDERIRKLQAERDEAVELLQAHADPFCIADFLNRIEAAKADG